MLVIQMQARPIHSVWLYILGHGDTRAGARNNNCIVAKRAKAICRTDEPASKRRLLA